jgi:quercetin dioxygenase-like cupin family protein
MLFVNTDQLTPWERLPGWLGRIFHSKNLTLARWDFSRGSSIHQHCHPTEEVWYVTDGELDITIEGETRVARKGRAAIVPNNGLHNVVALTDGSAFVVNFPMREDEPTGG